MLYAQSPRDFEQRVAAIYRVLGAQVTLGHVLAGNEVDVFTIFKQADGRLVRTAIECKAYAQPVDAGAVYAHGGLAALCKQRGLIDAASVVSASGFTPRARAAASELQVDLIEIAALESMVSTQAGQVMSAIGDLKSEVRVDAASQTRRTRAFVIMPFAREFDDVYVLGVREVAERIGIVADRADDIEHNENILAAVQQNIRACDLVIAETTTRNPNCFYEIGYAHALGKPTILIGRAGQEIPVDLRAMNHVFYNTIVELRDALARRIKATLPSSQGPSAT